MKKVSFILRLLSVVLTHHIGITVFKELGVGLGMGFYPNHIYSDKNYHMFSLTLLIFNIQIDGMGDIKLSLNGRDRKYFVLNLRENEITTYKRESPKGMAGTWKGDKKPIFG